MKVILPKLHKVTLIEALKRAGQNEIGGIIMGEQLSDGRFRIADLTVQEAGGTFMSFFRRVSAIAAPLKKFFQKTNHDYRRFNYMGEWHSHPSFRPEPSGQDIRSMLEILHDPAVGATFLVMMIVRLSERLDLEGTVTVFIPGQQHYRGILICEDT